MGNIKQSMTQENHRVQVFQSDGTFVGKFGTMGNRPGQLEHPHYIAVSCTNRVIGKYHNAQFSYLKKGEWFSNYLFY